MHSGTSTSSRQGPRRKTVRELLAIAKALVKQGIYDVDQRVLDQLHDLGIVGQEAIEKAIKNAVEEVAPECYAPVKKEFNIPGLQFIWDSRFFRRRMCLKFSVRGSKHKPRPFIWSCHPPYFGDDETKNQMPTL